MRYPERSTWRTGRAVGLASLLFFVLAGYLPAEECREGQLRVQIYGDRDLQRPLGAPYCAPMRIRGAQIQHDWDSGPLVVCTANCPGKEDKADRTSQAKRPRYAKPKDRFSVRWRTVVEVPRSAEYVFHGGADDGIRVLVDGAVVFEDWSVHAFRPFEHRVRLSEGSREIVVEYYENRGNARVEVGWRPVE